MKDRFRTMSRKAERKGWTRPAELLSPDRLMIPEAKRGASNLRTAWLRYWEACEDYERHPERGRPIPPHRSG